MESPTVLVERERERERVNSFSNFPHRHKIIFGLVVTIGLLVFVAFNLWIYRYAKSGKTLSQTALWQIVTSSNSGFGFLKKDFLRKQGAPVKNASGQPISPTITPTLSPTPTHTPTPTPRPTGPGQYACSTDGSCNLYEDVVRTKYCTKTYADMKCLDQCGTKENRCIK